MSALPPITDIRCRGRHVRFVPITEIVALFRGTGIGIALVSSGGIVMKLPRRHFLHLAAGAAALPAVSRMAWAQAYPTRPVRWIVCVAPGGTLDITARLMGQWLSDRLGQQFVIENRPGGGNNIGTETVVRAPADGYTLLLVSAANAINATLYDKLNLVIENRPGGGNNIGTETVVRAPADGYTLLLVSAANAINATLYDKLNLVMAVNPSVPARTVSEFIAYAKTNPGKFSMASGGNGSPAHVAGELLKMMVGIDMVHVPYRGGALALTDLLGGQVQVIFSPMPEVIETIKAGKVRALAVTTAARSEALPDIPTMGEFVPGYEASTWNGLGAPKNTPVEIVAKLNGAINAALADPKIKARLAALGGMSLAGSPADFSKLIADETEKWAKVVKFSGAKVD